MPNAHLLRHLFDLGQMAMHLITGLVQGFKGRAR